MSLVHARMIFIALSPLFAIAAVFSVEQWGLKPDRNTWNRWRADGAGEVRNALRLAGWQFVDSDGSAGTLSWTFRSSKALEPRQLLLDLESLTRASRLQLFRLSVNLRGKESKELEHPRYESWESLADRLRDRSAGAEFQLLLAGDQGRTQLLVTARETHQAASPFQITLMASETTGERFPADYFFVSEARSTR